MKKVVIAIFAVLLIGLAAIGIYHGNEKLEKDINNSQTIHK